jgi:diguanylate cyclase
LSALRNLVAESERERLALQKEVAQLRKDRESMEIEANYDTLTGLPNRRNFESKLATALEELESHPHPCALLIIDFDYFKSINDTFGHQAGDDVLKTLAAHLQESLQHSGQLPQAVYARYGGDEFSAILPGCGTTEANRLAESLRASIEGLHLEFNGHHCPLSISVGVAVFPAHTSAPETLFELADRALYRAKTSGRNRVCEPSSESGDVALEN